MRNESLSLFSGRLRVPHMEWRRDMGPKMDDEPGSQWLQRQSTDDISYPASHPLCLSILPLLPHSLSVLSFSRPRHVVAEDEERVSGLWVRPPLARQSLWKINSSSLLSSPLRRRRRRVSASLSFCHRFLSCVAPFVPFRPLGCKNHFLSFTRRRTS